MTELPGEWTTFLADSELTGANIIVTERTDLDRFRRNPRFKYRITVGLPYRGDATGMPSETAQQIAPGQTVSDAELIAQATDLMAETLHKDPVAVLTEISTGDNRREWVFHTLSLPIFSKKINEALAPLPLLPLEFTASEDPDFLTT